MTPPPSSPPALPSGALADEVRAGMQTPIAAMREEAPHNARISSAIAALAQLVARLKQAEQALERLTTMEAFTGVAVDLRFTETDTLRRELQARQEFARMALGDAVSDASTHSGGRRPATAGASPTSPTESALAACEAERDDALSALHYIKQRYGELDGVGWNRLTGEKA